MNNDRRMQLTVDRWREENGYAPLEAKVIDFPIKRQRTVAYRIGQVIGHGLFAATALAILAGAVYLVWRLV